jgi:hypothetical protein
MKIRNARSRTTRPVLQYTRKNLTEVAKFLGGLRGGVGKEFRVNENGSLWISEPQRAGFVIYPGHWLVNENGSLIALDAEDFKAQYILC